MGLHLSGSTTTQLNNAFVGGNVLGLGVKGDVKTVTDAAITSGQATISSTSAAFTSADVGKVVQVVGAGAPFNNRGAWASTTAYATDDVFTQGGVTYRVIQAFTSGSTFTTKWIDKVPATSATLHATILSVSGGVATLSTNAGTTVSGATCTYGTDDSAVITALPAGDYYFPGNRTYFLADWFLPSHTRVTVGNGAIFKLPSYPTTDARVFGLMTSNRALTTYVEDVHLYGRVLIDMTELTPPIGTAPRGIHILNAQDWSIDRAKGRGLPGHTGNVIQVGANTGGSVARRGQVGNVRNENVRGYGSSAVQHTGGTTIEYGALTADGGVAFRAELDSTTATADNVKVRMAYVNNDSGMGNTAVLFSAHTNIIRNVEVASVLAEGGADGTTWECSTSGTIEDCTVSRMRVTGGGRGSVTTQNDRIFHGCTIRDGKVTGAVLAPTNRDVSGTPAGMGFTFTQGMTLDNCRAESCAGGGFKDIFSSTGVVAGSRATIINPVAKNNTGVGIYVAYLEDCLVVGGSATDVQGTPTQTTGLSVGPGSTVRYLETVFSGNSVGATSGNAVPMSPVVDVNYLLRNSECATMTRKETNGAITAFSSGLVAAGVAVCQKAGTYTRARMFLTGAGSGVTGLKVGVWASDGASLLSDSGDLSASLPAANNFATFTLSTPLALKFGDQVFLGFAETHSTTSVGIRGNGPSAGTFWPQTAADGVIPYRGKNAASWAGGSNALPTTIAVGSGPGMVPLIELLP